MRQKLEKDIRELLSMDPKEAKGNIARMSKKDFQLIASKIASIQKQQTKENQLRFYRPVSPEAEKVHMATSKTVAVFGGNGCLPLDAPVLMANGKQSPLGDVKVGDFVMAADPATGETEPAMVSRTYRSGMKHVYQVNFHGGGNFRATAEHNVPLYAGFDWTKIPQRYTCPTMRSLGDFAAPFSEPSSKQTVDKIASVSPPLDRKEIGLRRRMWSSAQKLGLHECGDIEVDHPAHCYITGDNVIVSNSSKTESCLVELLMLATGIVPIHFTDSETIRAKMRGPVNCRVVCESLTTVLHPVILPKLQYWKWTGIDEPGGERGHWGWIPQNSLVGGTWDKSWSEKLRMLRVLYRDPDDPLHVVGESTIQFNCLRGDQRAAMVDGRWLPVSQLRVGDVLHGSNGRHVKVTKTYIYEDAPVVNVRTSRGRSIIATPNHQHFTDRGILTTDQLKVGDEMKLAALDLKPRRAAKPLEDWLLGWTAIMIGDGCMRGRQATFSATKPSRVLDDLPPLPPETKLRNRGSHKTDWVVTLKKARRDNPLIVALKGFGLWGLGSKDKFVPESFFRQPKERIAYFLKHLWNCDGSFPKNSRQAFYITTSRQLAYDVKYLLWRLGIYAGITEGEVVNTVQYLPSIPVGTKTYRYIVQVSGGSYDRLLAAFAGEDFASVPITTKGRHGVIKSIEPVGSEDVYCVEVDAEDHAFVVDGILTHNSHDQDPTDFASGDFHFILHDEPPNLAIWRENEARTMRVNGRMFLAMTWPDDPAIAVDWIYDEVYEPSQEGPNKDPHIDSVNLYTTDNPHLNQDAVAQQASKWSEEVRKVRIMGQHLRFSNRVHPLFTDQHQWWCFDCGKQIIPYENRCGCGSERIEQFCHVGEFDTQPLWPTVYLLDPHPRKPHMMMWVQVSPYDDLFQVAEAEVDGDPVDVRLRAEEVEREFGLNVTARLIDPNMGASRGSQTRHSEITVQDEFANAGLNCDLADRSDVGRGRVNEMLKPDEKTREPRLMVHARCTITVQQMKRYTWDDFKIGLDRPQKQKVREKYDDYPTLWKYLMNTGPSHSFFAHGPEVIHRRHRRRDEDRRRRQEDPARYAF